MGSCWLQLKLLVWKNFTLKKRKPLVFVLETSIPLVLFIIILCMRSKQPSEPVSQKSYPAFPLPSAGLLPISMDFCDNVGAAGLDSNGFTKVGAERIQELLTNLHNVIEANDIFKMQIPPVETMGSLLDTYIQTIEDFLEFSSTTEILLNVRFSDLFPSDSDVIDMYTKTLSMPLKSALQLQNTTLTSLKLTKLKYYSIIVALEGLFIKTTELLNSSTSSLMTQLYMHYLTSSRGLWKANLVRDVIQTLACDSYLTITNVSDLYEPGDYFLYGFCRLQPAYQTEVITKLLDRNNLGKLLEKTGLNHLDLVYFGKHFYSAFTNIQNLFQFMKFLEQFSNMASSLDFGPCSDEPQNTDEINNFVRIWEGLQNIICGANTSVENFKSVEPVNIADVILEGKEQFHLLSRIFRGKIKILYAPNNTAVNEIISKANYTFLLFETAQSYVRKIDKVSREFKLYISSDMMQEKFNSLMNIGSRFFNGSNSIQAFSVVQLFKAILFKEKSVLMNQLDKVQEAACHFLGIMPKQSVDIFQGFPSEEETLRYFQDRAYFENVSVFASIIFHVNGDGSLPRHVTYSIRQNATLTPLTKLARSISWNPEPLTLGSLYYQAGFTWIQDTIDRSIISIQAGRDVVEPATYLQRFPEPCHVYDIFFNVIQHILPLVMTTSFIYTVAMLVQNIVYEKEKRLKEVMKAMGMTDWIHWMSFFITSFVQLSVTIASLTLILKFGNILTHSSAWFIFFMFEAYAMATITFSFLISTLFSKAKLAAACAGIIYFMSYVPCIYITIREDLNVMILAVWKKLLMGLLSTTTFGIASKQLAYYERSGTGLHFSNWGIPPTEIVNLTVRSFCWLLLFDTLVYCTLIWYIQNVHPGSYGLPRPWYFPFTRSYWFGNRRGRKSFGIYGKIDESIVTTDPDRKTDSPQYFEPDPTHLPLGVCINNLVKVYKIGKKLAVDGLSLNFYEGQITSFLGHNGAGKTTTMSILTGLFPATSGTAHIYDLDIRKDMDSIRKNLGMCPQHNVLFDELTVEEHLWFYCRLKGMSSSEIIIEIEKVLADIDLLGKRNDRIDCLGGGMKRKLSVAIAFTGGSRTIILDEPTSGVDPCSRRAIWDLILKYKKGRTIILSTHHMAEAEILGDRIAIIANGKVKCCGSPLFLKTQLGTGYHLYLVKKECTTTAECESSDYDANIGTGQKVSKKHYYSSCCENAVTDFIRQSVPSASFESETPYELHYILPMVELRLGNFEKLFTSLDGHLDILQIKSYGVKSTTLEEIFLKVTSQHKDGGNRSDDQMKNGMCDMAVGVQDSQLVDLGNDGFTTDEVELHQATPFTDLDFSPSCSFDVSQQSPLQGHRLWLLQFLAILKKRFLCTKRNRKGMFSQMAMPAIFVAVAMTVALTTPSVDDPQPMNLSPSQYHWLTQPRGHFMPFTNHREDLASGESWSSDARSDQLENTLRMAAGLGATCVMKSPVAGRVESGNAGRAVVLNEEDFEPSCRPVFQHGLSWTNAVENTNLINMFFPSGDSSLVLKMTESSTKQNVTHASDSKPIYHPHCTCKKDSSGFRCSSDGYENPPEFKVVSGETLVNVTGDNEIDYLLYTEEKFRQHRYGLLTFGVTRPFIPESFGEKMPATFRKIAVRNAVKVWYNMEGFHSMPTYLNVLNNAILRANLPANKGDPSAYGITVINHPLPDTNSISEQEILAQGTDVVIAIFVITAMAFIPASFVLFLVTERHTKAKHLQMVSGVRPVVYWMANYVWDFCNSVFPAIVCILILVIFDVRAYSSETNLPVVITLFLFYGWSVTPVMYPVSFLFKEPSTAYVFLIVVNLFIGISCIITDTLLKHISGVNASLRGVYEIVQMFFMVFPNYCLGQGLVDLSSNDWHNVYLEKTGRADETVSPWAWHIIPKKLLAMSISGIVFFLITLMCDRRTSKKNLRQIGKTYTSKTRNEDDDVALERRRVLNGGANDDVLKLENLTKVYRTSKLGDCLAVDDLALGIRQGECFGLLGTNGAGKTTVFAMLSGDIASTEGDVYINGLSITKDFARVQPYIGYCPQFEALYDELTGREHLNMYCCFRGIPWKEIEQTVNWALSKMDLVPYADRLASTYSGGNRRKLSSALAVIGNPKVIFMDEPSTGMDPHSRRFLWEAILDLIKNGHSVVLSSHSMEECEALCSRVAFMVNGRFCCLGSVQHLKNKFGGGYFITVRIKEKQITPVRNFFEATFPESILKDEHHNVLHYELKSANTSLAYIFSCMEAALTQLPIEDYSVCQNTLDNVFVNFVNQHTGTSPRDVTNMTIENRPKGTGLCPDDKLRVSAIDSNLNRLRRL